ncbi:MAG: Cgl0159 family (beta/alpha)8-fold protein [Saccharofermentanales bacterium]|jgi:hypothetical protein
MFDYNFDYNNFLNTDTFLKISEMKTLYPERIQSEADARPRFSINKNKLIIVAADHNARMICGYRNNPIRLANRQEYLSRLIRVLLSPLVTGVESTPDIIEDLFAINILLKAEYGIDILRDRVLIGTINRGGLKGSVWEMDDRPCCFTLERIKALGLNGAKFMLRLNPYQDDCRYTLTYCSDAINEAFNLGTNIFIEILFVEGDEEIGYTINKDVESIVKSVGVVSALGCSSLNKYLELPINKNYIDTVTASTCPVLVVPDEREFEDLEVVREYTEQSSLSKQVKGILLGRNVLFSDSDPVVIAHAIACGWQFGLSLSDSMIHAKELNILECI